MFSGPNCRKERGRSNVLDLSKYRCSPAHRLPTDQALARCLSPRHGGVSRSFYLDSSFPVLLKHSAPYIDPSTTKRPKNSIGLCTKNIIIPSVIYSYKRNRLYPLHASDRLAEPADHAREIQKETGQLAAALPS